MLHNLCKVVIIKTKCCIVLLKSFMFFVFVPFSPYWFFFFFIRLSWLLLSTEMIKRDCCAMHGGRFS